MTRRKKAAIVLVWMIGWVAGFGQSTQGSVADAEMTAASLLVGRALFLRGFYLNNELTYDAAGKVRGEPKVGDWTLAAVNVLKVARRGTGEIELDGVRAAARYNTDNHEFERHVLKDEKIQVLIADPGDAGRESGRDERGGGAAVQLCEPEAVGIEMGWGGVLIEAARRRPRSMVGCSMRR